MNYEQLAFFNQQLAGMLQSGIPLEGALRRLSMGMSAGKLRDEVRLLEADLQEGRPLEESLARRDLPVFYTGMIRVGARSDDLPGALILVADYYGRLNAVWTRLKGLMVYPFLVLSMAFVVSFLVAWLGLHFYEQADLQTLGFAAAPARVSFALWVFSAFIAPLVLALVLLGFVMAVTVPGLRSALRWRLPGFREASLASLASALSILLRSGVTLREALVVVGELEPGLARRGEFSGWAERLAEGRAKFAELAGDSRVVPPLFVWLVASGGEDLAGGFGRAAEIFQARALYRIEMILYCVLPVSILLLGLMILGQTVPLVQPALVFMREMSQWM